MTLESPTAPKLATWQPLQETVAEFRSECHDLEDLLQSFFEDLDRLRSEVERKGLELDAERRRSAEQERQLSQQRDDALRLTKQIDLQHEKLDVALKQLADLSGLLATDRQTPVVAAVDSQRVTELQTERDSLQRELESLRTKAQDLERQRDELTGELKHLRRFIEMQAELMIQRGNGATSETAPPGNNGGGGAVVSSVASQFAKMQRDSAERRKARG